MSVKVVIFCFKSDAEFELLLLELEDDEFENFFELFLNFEFELFFELWWSIWSDILAKYVNMCMRCVLCLLLLLLLFSCETNWILYLQLESMYIYVEYIYRRIYMRINLDWIEVSRMEHVKIFFSSFQFLCKWRIVKRQNALLSMSWSCMKIRWDLLVDGERKIGRTNGKAATHS